MITNRKILQVIPAPGWYAVRQAEGHEPQFLPLVCWAFVEEIENGTSYQNVDGVVAFDMTEFADEKDFVCYCHESEIEKVKADF